VKKDKGLRGKAQGARLMGLVIRKFFKISET